MTNPFIVWLMLPLLISCQLALGQSSLWAPLPLDLNYPPRVFYEDTVNDVLIIGGRFTTVNDSPAPNLLSYDGLSFEAISKGYETVVPEPPTIIRRFQGQLYAAGFAGMSRQVGQQWEMISQPYGLSFWDLQPYEDKLIATGKFTNFMSQGLNKVALWDGSQWSSFFGIDTLLDDQFHTVNRVRYYKGEWYVAGNIDMLGAINEIARFDGEKWTDVGGGIVGTGLDAVTDMEIFQGELYVAGTFYSAYGAPGNLIARWDGERWDDVGGGMQGGQILDIMVFRDQLWALGQFTKAGGVPAERIAKWDGERWCGLGSSFDNELSCLGYYRDTLYLGGGFWSIDGDSSMDKVAKLLDPYYADTCSAPVVASVATITPEKPLTAYPNPAQGQLTLQATFSRAQVITLHVHNALGQRILTQREPVPAGRWQKRLEVADWPAGVYLVKVAGDDAPRVLKVLKQ